MQELKIVPTAKQEADVLRYMEEHGRISQIKATYELNCTRLGARIWDLEHKRGIRCDREMIYHTDEDGNRSKWMEYWLPLSYRKRQNYGG